VPEESVACDAANQSQSTESQQRLPGAGPLSEHASVATAQFKAEVVAGREMFLPDLSFPGGIAVAERNGRSLRGDR